MKDQQPPTTPKNKPPVALKQIDEVRGTFHQMLPQFKMALPAQIPVERFMRVAVTAINNNPKLLECNRNSLYAAAMLAAQDGLLPDGRQGAIVPFGNEAKWMPMVGGLLAKVRNSGELSSIHPDVFYENDEFDYWSDECGVHLNHRPNLHEDRGEMMGAYCIAKTIDGGVYVEVMSREEIEKVQKMSRSRTGPWQDWQGEMWKKTVIRRLSKRLPMSTDADELIRREEREHESETKMVQTAPPRAGGLKRLEAIVAAPSADAPAIEHDLRQPDSHAATPVEPAPIEGPFPFEKEPKKG